MRVKNGKTGEMVDIVVSEAEFLKVLKRITTKLAYHWQFGIHKQEDIEQEIARFCLEALYKYNGKYPLYTFLLVDVNNKLINLKRDEFYRPTCPCNLCNNKKQGETNHFDKRYCKQFVEWKDRNAHKANIAAPQSMPENFDYGAEPSTLENMCNEELYQLIDEKLPVRLRTTYLKMKSGVRVGHIERTEVLNFLKELINQ